MEKLFKPTFFTFLLYRLSSVFIVQTSHVPDEYWQSLEVAHNMAYGYGYLTWEWKHEIRSYLYPFCFYLLYKVLAFCHLDYPFLVILIPKVFQATLTAFSDLFFYKICRNFGYSSYWACFNILTNWFWYYTGFRTITNTFETAFTIIALYFYPWSLFVDKRRHKSSKTIESDIKLKTFRYLTLATINCAMRPTAITIWGPLVFFQLLSLYPRHIQEFLKKCVLPAILIGVLPTIIIDTIWYRKFTIPPLNFFIFNIYKGISSFYGTHSFHWYLSQGLPVVLGLQFLPFLVGIFKIIGGFFWKAHDPLKMIYLMWISILVINFLLLSNIPHKEFRFILPLLPLMMLIIVKASSDFFTYSSKKLKSIWIILLSAVFIILSALFGILHQRGTLQLMGYLRSSIQNCQPYCYFLFLMPCHSTPLYCHLHANVTTRFITCEPPLNDNDFDESVEFFNDPLKWLINFWDDKEIPSHIAFFDSVEKLISSFLHEKGFSMKNKFLHTFFAQGNAGKYIIVYEPS